MTSEGVPIFLGNSTVARVSMDSPFSQSFNVKHESSLTPSSVAVPAVTATAIYSLVPGAILDSRDFSGYYRIREFTPSKGCQHR